MAYIYLDLLFGTLPLPTLLFIAMHVPKVWAFGTQTLKMVTLLLPPLMHLQMQYFIMKLSVCYHQLAIDNIQTRALKGSKIVIFTDNVNSVDIFRSLRCLPAYNQILKTAVDIIIQNEYSLQVFHVPGEQNVVADALSRVRFSVAFSCEPSLTLYNFNPPGLEGSAK